MKTLGLVCALLAIAAVSCSAVPATIDIYPGYNQVGCGQVPFDGEPYAAFGGNGSGECAVDLENSGLSRWDATSQSLLIYGMNESFGNLLIGDGYTLYSDAGGTIEFDAVADGVPNVDANGNAIAGTMTDMWVSLPGSKEYPTNKNEGGYQLVSNPFAHDVPVYSEVAGDFIFNVKFTNGSTTLSWMDAIDAGWVEGAMYGWDGASQSVETLLFDSGESVKAGKAYWVKTLVDDLAMIVRADLNNPNWP